MIRSVVAGLALLAVSPSAHAGDARLVTRAYNAEQVVLIESRAGVQATIAFADGEQIENVAIGDANLWQVTPNKRANLLFVKPLAVRARTNLTVVTDRRSYFFDLVASPTARPLYALRFTYGPEPKGVSSGRQPVPAVAREESMVAVGGLQPAQPSSPNFAWRARGKSALVPSRIYDDGVSTFLTWPAGTPIPAMLVRNEKGQEGPVNFSVHGNVVVIDGVPELLVLRAGRASAILENRRGATKTRSSNGAFARASEDPAPLPTGRKD